MASKKKVAKDTAPSAASVRPASEPVQAAAGKASTPAKPKAIAPAKPAASKPGKPTKPAAPAAPPEPVAAVAKKEPGQKVAATKVGEKNPPAKVPAPKLDAPKQDVPTHDAPTHDAPAKAAGKAAVAKQKPAKVPASKAAEATPASPAKPEPAPKPAVTAKPLVAAKAQSPAKAAPAAKPPAGGKAPPRRSFAALDDVGGPDDDDLEDDDGEARAPRAPVAELEEPVEAPPPPPRRLTPRVVPPMPARKPGVITMAVSPDADDAYMLYALAHGKVDTEGRRYEIVRGEIAQLNDETLKGTYDVSAFSFGAWAQVSERYLMLPTGASLGDGVGPVVVSKTVVRPNEVNGLVVGVPGVNTTAALVLRLWLHPARLQLVPLPFDGVVEAVKGGKVRAGVLIHEAQLTYRLDGLTKVVDLGRWWTDRTDGLPLPLGGMVVRRDIPAEERSKISLDLKRSIAYAMGHRDEAIQHAQQFAKGLPRPLLERYIAQYVNELTLDLGERGKQAVQALFDAALRLGLTREPLELELG
jgi:1,4-dihydroxy-6-naphthoate synthase